MTKKVTRIYETPAVETMECRVERGFAGSDGKGLGLNGESGGKAVESRSNGGNWGGGETKWN